MPNVLPLDDSDVAPFVSAILDGDHDSVTRLLAARPELATAWFGDETEARTCLHVATDWPGHFPGVAATIARLVAAGADVDAPFIGRHTERPLHWAASSGDLAALDALIVAGADLESSGGVLTGGSPLDDAVIFGMLDAARRLVAAGATVQLFHAAALDMDDVVASHLASSDAPQEHLDAALWHARERGAAAAERLLLDAGADPDAPPPGG